MRARSVIIFCLVLNLVPCFATSPKQQTKRKLNYKQVAVYGLVAAAVNSVVSTTIAAYYADMVRKTNPNAWHSNSARDAKSARDVLELVDAKINQELASRGLGQLPLDELD
ncbi:hypothetical protein F5888DRAFT_1807874 [Russula emetica]|nr:hypothetical protein F5888DRAFT_1807874 [Russula emetica]